MKSFVVCRQIRYGHYIVWDSYFHTKREADQVIVRRQEKFPKSVFIVVRVDWRT